MYIFEKVIGLATGEHGREKQTLPGVVVAAENKSGTFKYHKAFGFRSVAPDSASIDLNSTFRILSCTKLLTSIAALQCVERGLIGLDEDVSRVLVEWKEPDILVGFDEKKIPILRRATKTITLRHLLTHSAGMGYEFMSAKLAKWRKVTKTAHLANSRTIRDRHLTPLLYEPGEGWAYSCSIDWAGQVVERLTDDSLEAYMTKNIFNPLNMSSTTFRLDSHPDIKSRLVDMAARDPKTNALSPGARMGFENLADDFGGGGLISSPSDYIKVLRSLLRNDEVLLRKETVDIMFSPQLEDPKHLKAFAAKQEPHLEKGFLCGLPGGTQVNWGLGGLLNMTDDGKGKGMRSRGSLSWSGLPNLFWFIDPKHKVCGIYATNLLPVGDPKAVEMYCRFERAVIKELGDLESKI